MDEMTDFSLNTQVPRRLLQEGYEQRKEDLRSMIRKQLKQMPKLLITLHQTLWV